jgi:hypothetical protein
MLPIEKGENLSRFRENKLEEKKQNRENSLKFDSISNRFSNKVKSFSFLLKLNKNPFATNGIKEIKKQ